MCIGRFPGWGTAAAIGGSSTSQAGEDCDGDDNDDCGDDGDDGDDDDTDHYCKE